MNCGGLSTRIYLNNRFFNCTVVKILVFGDSIAWGAYDTEAGGWVERLKTFFLKSYEKKGVGIYNFSVSSNDTRGVLHFLQHDISKLDEIEQEDKILLFSMGSNDARHADNKTQLYIPEKEFQCNLTAIVKIAKKHSSTIIFTGLLKVDEQITLPWNTIDSWNNKDIQHYNSIIESFCKKEKLHFIPFWNLLSAKDLADGLHPNSKGHKKIYRKVKQYLLPSLV